MVANEKTSSEPHFNSAMFSVQEKQAFGAPFMKNHRFMNFHHFHMSQCAGKLSPKSPNRHDLFGRREFICAIVFDCCDAC